MKNKLAFIPLTMNPGKSYIFWRSAFLVPGEKQFLEGKITVLGWKRRTSLSTQYHCMGMEKGNNFIDIIVHCMGMEKGNNLKDTISLYGNGKGQ